jgi:excisionase family DNA binding protein
MSDTQEEELYSTRKVAATFAVTTETVRNWIETGKLKAIKVNTHWRVPRSEVIRMAKERHGDG